MNRVRHLQAGALAALLLVSLAEAAAAVEDRTPRVHALVGARVVVQPGKTLERATVVVRDGIVVAVAPDAEPPADARLWDLEGRTLYPGLIEPYLDPASGKKKSDDEKAADDADEVGVRHPNPNVRAERRVAATLDMRDEQREALRAVGFTTAHVVPSRGIFRGRSAVVALRDGAAAEQLLSSDAAHLIAFEHGSWGDAAYRKNPTYPSALMGAVALVRQTLLDTRWAWEAAQRYARNPKGLERPQSNLSLEALAPVLPQAGGAPVWVVTEDVLGTLRSAALAREFELDAVLVGNGEEYQYADEVERAGFPVVLPVAFPEAPQFADEDDALGVELDVLRHWDAAPGNPARMHEAGIEFAFTSHGLDKRSTLRAQVRRAIESGLPESAALAALTTVPARLLGVDDRLGSIEAGKIANFTVTNGDLFAEDTRVLAVWVDGDHYAVRDRKKDDVEQVAGRWRVVAGTSDDPVRTWTLEVRGNEWTLRATLEDARGAVPVRDLRWDQGELIVQIGVGERVETLRLRAAGKKELAGTWSQVDGTRTQLAASRPEPSAGGER